jgi:hypothetical protein
MCSWGNGTESNERPRGITRDGLFRINMGLAGAHVPLLLAAATAAAVGDAVAQCGTATCDNSFIELCYMMMPCDTQHVPGGGLQASQVYNSNFATRCRHTRLLQDQLICTHCMREGAATVYDDSLMQQACCHGDSHVSQQLPPPIPIPHPPPPQPLPKLLLTLGP